jgi:hypothetical protein
MAVNYDTDTGNYTGAQLTKFWVDSKGKWVETNDFIDGHAVFEPLDIVNDKKNYLVLNGFNNQDNAEQYSGKIQNVKLVTSLGVRVLTVPTNMKGQSCWNQTVYSQLLSTGYGDVVLKLDKKSTNTANANGQTVDTVMREKRGEATAKGFVNRAPVAVDDNVSTEMNVKRLNITVLSNDYDPQNAALTVAAITSNPSHGTATINADGTVDYVPETDWFGVDQFSYMVQNQYGGTDTATVTVTVSYDNQMQIISIDSSENLFDKPSDLSSISRDGRFVAYRIDKKDGWASPSYANSMTDKKLLLYDRGKKDLSGAIAIVNATDQSNAANFGEQIIAKSGKTIGNSGTQVIFGSEANNLLANLDILDTNGVMDVFVASITPDTSSKNSKAATLPVVKEFPKGGTVSPIELNPTTIVGENPPIGEEDRFVISRTGDATGWIDTTVQVEYLKPANVTGWISNLPMNVYQRDNSYTVILEYDTIALAADEYEAKVTIQGYGTVMVYMIISEPMKRVSISTAGVEGNGVSYPGSISEDGQQAVYYSEANNLVVGDTNKKNDVFVRDTANNVTIRLSVSTAGVQSNGDSEHPSVSGDGRMVVFASDATNLVDGSTLNGFKQIYLYDRDVSNSGVFDVAGNTSTTLISVDADGAEGNGDSDYPEVDGTGGVYYVVYHSAASNLDGNADTNGVYDVFRYDVANKTTTCMSLSSSGVRGNGDSVYPSLTADGMYVTYQSEANSLVAGDNNSRDDIFLRNVAAGTTTIVTRNDSGELSNAASVNPAIGTDGNNIYISFTSDATNLIDEDTNGVSDIFVHIQDDTNN